MGNGRKAKYLLRYGGPAGSKGIMQQSGCTIM